VPSDKKHSTIYTLGLNLDPRSVFFPHFHHCQNGVLGIRAKYEELRVMTCYGGTLNPTLLCYY